MSVNAESSDGVDDEEKWFFTWLLEVQAETMLNKGSSGGQTRTSRFPVSNLPSSKDYRISIRRGIERAGNITNNVEHIMITYNEEDQSYGIEGQKRYQSVVEVVRNYIASHDEGNHTVTDTSSNIRSNESTRTEEPPAYTQHPTDNQPLPQIKTKLDINKVEEANERRLAEQQAENEAEGVRLQALISRMESSLSNQTRQLEQERWKLQQDSVRLNAQQAAFDQDRALFTSRMEQERADLQVAKDKFLAEQHEIMSKCYEEHRAVADEQSKLSSTQKVSKEKELREIERLVKMEKTLKLQVERLQQESSRLAEERTKLLEEQEMQESHHKALQEHKRTVTDREKEADRKLQQAIEMHEMATKMYKQGEQSLQEAQVLKETAESQLASVRSQQVTLQKREKHLTQERLNFVKERKEQIQETYNSAGMQVTATIDNIHDSVNSDDIILPSLDHTTLPAALPTTRSHMGNLLDQLDTSIQLRRIAMEAEQDDEYLEEEKNFLASLRNSGRLTLMELESS